MTECFNFYHYDSPQNNLQGNIQEWLPASSTRIKRGKNLASNRQKPITSGCINEKNLPWAGIRAEPAIKGLQGDWKQMHKGAGNRTPAH